MALHSASGQLQELWLQGRGAAAAPVTHQGEGALSACSLQTSLQAATMAAAARAGCHSEWGSQGGCRVVAAGAWCAP